ncbi:MAG: hypothetical protein A3K10_05960 [Bacteroidetes bacterium RIFCSPLOWO2_12_FULL_31_6]|nr:MAG: hypothetical protein A3K10_05960 [Bacteroidetes bacterium RIFCSPLOWO2_12_FULL_31_6]
MELLVRLKKYKVFLLVIGVIVASVLGGKDTNYWGLRDKSGEQILAEIDNGILISKEVILTENQEIEIADLIAKNPNNYSAHQKALISKKTGAEILDEIGAGKVNVKEVWINYDQNKEIIKLIYDYPDRYNEQQTYLIRVKPPEEILIEIGNGIRNPNHIKLTPSELKKIRELIEKNPDKYNDDQKLLLK